MDANENALVFEFDTRGRRDRLKRLDFPKGSRAATLRTAKGSAANRKRPVTLAGSPLSKDVDS